MTIGEHHPYKTVDGKPCRLCYRNKYVAIDSESVDWRYYDGQEIDEERSGTPFAFHEIVIKLF